MAIVKVNRVRSSAAQIDYCICQGMMCTRVPIACKSQCPSCVMASAKGVQSRKC